MVKRKKRLQKGIDSLREQIKLHEDKLKSAEEEGMKELVDYYNRELEAKKRTLKEKEDILDKQWGAILTSHIVTIIYFFPLFVNALKKKLQIILIVSINFVQNSLSV